MYRKLVSPHGRELVLKPGTIMGILNVTPDSFYDGGRYNAMEKAVARAIQMVEEGAEIIDIGGESTRPGADSVPLEEELRRVIPVIEALRDKTGVFISIDTYKSKVAEEALKRGADIVNDISGLAFDANMRDVVAHFNAPLIIMHIKGTPKDMQKNPHYDNVVAEIKNYFEERVAYAIEGGVAENKIILDPGIGFGKTVQHNFQILKNIEEFMAFGFPLLVGHSRKSFIGLTLDGIPPEDRLEGTLAVTAYLVLKGVDILRVHDVRENRRVVRLIESIRNA